MKMGPYEFYAKHYSDIGHLLEFEQDVRNNYPQEIGDLLHEAFKDKFNRFAGEDDWESGHYNGRDSYREVLWFREAFELDVYFGIGDLKNAAERLPNVKSEISCYLAVDNLKPRARADLQRQRSHLSRLRKKGYRIAEKDWWLASFQVGDLLHISNFSNRKRNIENLISRSEDFVRACLPLLQRA